MNTEESKFFKASSGFEKINAQENKGLGVTGETEQVLKILGSKESLGRKDTSESSDPLIPIRRESSSNTVKFYREGSEDKEAEYNYNYFRNNSISIQTVEAAEAETFIKQELHKAFEIKKRASALFSKNKLELALNEYTKALQILQIDSKYQNFINPNFVSVKTKCMSDIAICYYKLKSNLKAIAITDEIIRLQKHNFDAHFIKAKALKCLERHQESLESVKAALAIKSSKSLLKDYKFLEERIKLESDKLKEDVKSTTEHYSSRNTLHEDNEVNLNEAGYCCSIMRLFNILRFELLSNLKKNNFVILLIMGLITYYLRKKIMAKICSIFSFVYGSFIN